MILEIKTFPSEILREKSEPVTEFNDELHKLLDNMFETMYAAKGIGLAAPQVGVLKRFFVLDDLTGPNNKNPMEIIVKSMYEVLDDLTFSKDNYTSDYSINFCKKTLNWLKQYEDELPHYKAIFEKTYNTFNDYYIFWLKCLFILFVLGIMFAQGYGLGYYSQHLCEEKKNDFNPLPREN